MNKVCIITTVHNALDNRVFYREACSLQKAGYQVTLIAVHDRLETQQGIMILPLKRLMRSQRPLLWWKVLRMALATKADIYHIHDPELLFVSPLIRLLSGRPVIYDIHESVADFIELKDDIPYVLRWFLSWTFRWLEPVLAHMQSGLIFADDQIANAFQRVQLPKITLFNFPTQLFLQTAAHTFKKSQPSQPIVLYLGGLKRNRGTNLMLESFKQVLDVVPQAKLFLVGPFAPESHEKEVRSAINLKNMADSVTITGLIPFDRISEYLTQASIGWIPFPSVPKYQKNIPTKLFEYMAYAIPVVSSDLYPVQPFIENRKTGILVKADDPSAHARAIIELFSDTSLAVLLGNNGQKKVLKHFRWSEMEKRLISLYQQVLSQ
jgi:glycosyltransferase involved in cell wall biosynthesis